MTVNYNQDVATERLGGFFALLFRWRGSIYHAVYGEIGIFLILYYILSFIYRFALQEPQRTTFEHICIYCEQFVDYIPVTFILGFYLVRVIVRRWTMWENIPWPDRFSLDVSVYLQGCDVRARVLRRTLVRYVNLASVLCIRDLCVPVRRRFPSLDHLVSAGLMTPEELGLFQRTASKRDTNWWIPFQWAYTLLFRAQQEGKLTEGSMMRLHDIVQDLRNRCWVLFSHDWIPIPMVYTQVCTLSVYMFMVASLFGRQYLDPDKKYPKHDMDLYFPYFTIFQLTFYLGWLKVAEVLINPMGLDADDFDMNYIVDRNVRVAYTMVDDNYNKLPPVERDIYWGIDNPTVPHTEASKGINDTPFVGSAVNDKGTTEESRQIPADADEYGESAANLNTAENQTNLRQRLSSLSSPGVGGLMRRFLSRSNSNQSQENISTSKSNLLNGNMKHKQKGSRYCSRDSRMDVSQLQGIKETNENLLDLIPNEDSPNSNENPDENFKEAGCEEKVLWLIVDQAQNSMDNDGAPYSAPVLPSRSVSDNPDKKSLTHSSSNIV